MTDYLTLTEFVPGTKAKAQEVNANFSALKDAIMERALLNGDSTQKFSVAEATAAAHATSKAQLDSLDVYLSNEIKKYGAKFCARSGNVTSGKADLFSYSGLLVSPNIDSGNMKLVIADYLGNESVITSASSFSMSGKANGTYYVYIKADGTLYTLANNVYRQATRPTLVDGDLWLDTSAVPFKCISYTDATDVEFLDVPIAKIVIANSAISSLETLPYNQDGFEVNVLSFSQSLSQSGWSKLPNGLIFQWGSSQDNTLVTLPITFPNSCLGAYCTALYADNLTATGSYCASVNGVSTSQIKIGDAFSAVSSVNTTVRWFAVGY